MIQKLNDRRGSVALAQLHRESTSLDADSPETWGSWHNRRFELCKHVFLSLIHDSLWVGFTPWRWSRSPYGLECAALAIKYAYL